MITEETVDGRSLPGARRRDWDAVDATVLQVVRLVLDDGWTAQEAAAEVRRGVSDQFVLRRAWARVERALAERRSAIAVRAAATLRLAMTEAGS